MGNRHPAKKCVVCGKFFRSAKALATHRNNAGHAPVKRLIESGFITTERRMSIKKPEYTSSLVTIKQGMVLPPSFLATLVKENPTGMGIVAKTPKGLIVEKHQFKDDVEETIKDVAAIIDGTIKFDRMIAFHSFPSEYDEAELQPWTLVKSSAGKPLLCVGIEGDFPNYVDPNKEFGEAYQLLDTWLGDKVAEMYKLVGNNPTKLLEYLKGGQFTKDFSDQIGHRGSLVFVPEQGPIFSAEKNDQGVSGPWGDATFSYGYTEPVEVKKEEPKPEVAAPKEKGLKKSSFLDDDDGAKPKVEPKPTVAPPAEPAKEEPLTETKTMSPPRGFHGKQLKQWYRDTGGELPNNWRDRPDITVKASKPAPTTKKTETAVAAAMQTAEQQKADREAALMRSLPIIDGTKQKAANEFINRYLGDGSAVIKDPADARKVEEKLAKATDLIEGVTNLRDFEKFTTSFMSALVKTHPELAWLLLLQYRSAFRDLSEMGDQKVGDLTGTEAPASPASTPSPEPEKKEEKKVARGASRWS
jgi:hypothetical protein